MSTKSILLAVISLALLSGCGMANPQDPASGASAPSNMNGDKQASGQDLPPGTWDASEYLPSEKYTTPNETPGVLVNSNMDLYNDDYAAHTPYVMQTVVENHSSGIIVEAKNSTIESFAIQAFAANVTRFSVGLWTGIGANGVPNLTYYGSFAPNQAITFPAGVTKFVVFFGDDTTAIGLDYTVGSHFMFLSRISMNSSAQPLDVDNLEITNIP